jgi:nitrogen fixation protein FixH
MEIVKGVHDLIIVLGFVGIIIISRAVMTYLAIRQDKATDQVG